MALLRNIFPAISSRISCPRAPGNHSVQVSFQFLRSKCFSGGVNYASILPPDPSVESRIRVWIRPGQTPLLRLTRSTNSVVSRGCKVRHQQSYVLKSQDGNAVRWFRKSGAIRSPKSPETNSINWMAGATFDRSTKVLFASIGKGRERKEKRRTFAEPGQKSASWFSALKSSSREGLTEVRKIANSANPLPCALDLKYDHAQMDHRPTQGCRCSAGLRSGSIGIRT